MSKFRLLHYVREITGQPNYKLISDLLHAAAVFLDVMPDIDETDEFGEEALRKFYDRVPEPVKQVSILDPLSGLERFWGLYVKNPGL